VSQDEISLCSALCHVIVDTEVYEVPLVGADGTKVKAVTVCHLNTSAWSPDHMAFQVLKIKPGPAVCHFLDSDRYSRLGAKEGLKNDSMIIGRSLVLISKGP